MVFAALLLARPIPGIRTVWRPADPQVVVGQTIAWGQYVVGLLPVLLALTPVFGVPQTAGALIEIGFEEGTERRRACSPPSKSWVSPNDLIWRWIWPR
jgi:glutamate:Na+ symporter, ESS family